MTKNTQNKLQNFKIKYYHNANTGSDNTRLTTKNCASALLGALLLTTIIIAPASAQDKYHPTETGPPKHKIAELLLPTCSKSFHCRMQRLLKWLQTIEIDIYLDIRFHIHIRMKPEEALNKLSLIEDKLKKQGRIAPTIKAELDALRGMISKG